MLVTNGELLRFPLVGIGSRFFQMYFVTSIDAGPAIAWAVTIVLGRDVIFSFAIADRLDGETHPDVWLPFPVTDGVDHCFVLAGYFEASREEVIQPECFLRSSHSAADFGIPFDMNKTAVHLFNFDRHRYRQVVRAA